LTSNTATSSNNSTKDHAFESHELSKHEKINSNQQRHRREKNLVLKQREKMRENCRKLSYPSIFYILCIYEKARKQTQAKESAKTKKQ